MLIAKAAGDNYNLGSIPSRSVFCEVCNSVQFSFIQQNTTILLSDRLQCCLIELAHVIEWILQPKFYVGANSICTDVS